MKKELSVCGLTRPMMDDIVDGWTETKIGTTILDDAY